jgi:quercetin dioxygenase-like cupin family protein
MRSMLIVALLCLLLPLAASAHGEVAAERTAIVTPVMTQALADYPGKEAVMLVVEYPPGSVDPIHRHDADAFIYILEGTIEMAVNGEAPIRLTAGQSYHEGPKDVHTIGRNASQDKPARFVVVLLKTIGAPLLTPVP